MYAHPCILPHSCLDSRAGMDDGRIFLSTNFHRLSAMGAKLGPQASDSNVRAWEPRTRRREKIDLVNVFWLSADPKRIVRMTTTCVSLEMGVPATSFDMLVLNSGKWLLADEQAAAPWHVLIYQQVGEPRNELHLWLPRDDSPRTGCFACKRYWVNSSVRWCLEVPRDPSLTRSSGDPVSVCFSHPDGRVLWAKYGGSRGLGDLGEEDLRGLLTRAVEKAPDNEALPDRRNGRGQESSSDAGRPLRDDGRLRRIRSARTRNHRRPGSL